MWGEGGHNMADTKLELEKALNTNYRAVQEKEITIDIEAEKIKKGFTEKANQIKKNLQT